MHLEHPLGYTRCRLLHPLDRSHEFARANTASSWARATATSRRGSVQGLGSLGGMPDKMPLCLTCGFEVGVPVPVARASADALGSLPEDARAPELSIRDAHGSVGLGELGEEDRDPIYWLRAGKLSGTIFSKRQLVARLTVCRIVELTFGNGLQ